MSEVKKVRVAVRSLIDGTETEREYEGDWADFKAISQTAQNGAPLLNRRFCFILAKIYQDLC